MISQQIIAANRLALPLIITYVFYPTLFDTQLGIITSSLALGVYMYWLSRRELYSLINSLKFSPTLTHKQMLDELITSCNVQPETVVIRYAYTSEMLAMAAGTTIVLDPVICSTITDDPEAKKVLEIYTSLVEPTLSSLQKQRLHGFTQALSTAAQRFIFKHELGHVVRNYSQKKLILVGCLSALSAYAGITAAMLIIHISGLYAALVGISVGFTADILLTYLSNATFKYYEEKQADLFAARFSSAQDIRAAADFFAQHQDILNTHTEVKKWAVTIPSIIASGHPDGKARAIYLRKLASSK